MIDKAKKSEVPALDRGLDVLELISNQGPVGFGEIVGELSLPTASTARILKRLCQRGYVTKDDESGVYGIGDAVEELTPAKNLAQRLQNAAAGVLKELRDLTTQTAILFHWNGHVWECVGKELHENSIMMQTVGEVRVDIYSYPWGAFALEQVEKEGSRLMLEIGDDEETRVRQHLAEYRELGYVISSNRIMHRLAVPIKDPSGALVGALALGVMPPVFETMGQDEISRLLIDGGRRIEENLFEQ